ncbi:hypothetical protein [uncultured Tateyamaria sp.]|uniref:DUF6990 domain-containing protein n=1 Tax=uncultured Tateyamaria sp. TaxID=455651 RepID=UPI00262D8305|nr:hypothetical protein [uncultured Tateyamaria sp.]
MNMKDACKELEQIGWRIATDEVGDKYAVFDLPDRQVRIIPDIRRIRGEQQLAASPTLSTDKFSDVCAKIRGRGTGYTPLVRAWKGIKFKVPEVQIEHVVRLSDEAIDWAKKQDLPAALLEHAGLPTNAPGARPIWHLAALVILGDVSKLRSYRSSFAAGDRLDFVNYVTPDYIERAEKMAESGET